MIKAIFLDFDWTLYSHKNHSIPDSAKEALIKAHDKGIKIFVATGRSPDEIELVPEVHSIPFDGFVLVNGQLCLDANMNKLVGTPMKGPMLDRIVKLFCDMKQSVVLVSERRSYINFDSPIVKKAHEVVSYIEHPVDKYTGEDTYVAVLFVDSEDEKKYQEYLYDCDFKRWGPYGIDVVPKGVDKVTGIKYFLNKYGITKDECMVFGDSFNDLQMVAFAGIGVALGNAEQCVKDQASYVTSDIDCDGVKNALMHFNVIHF